MSYADPSDVAVRLGRELTDTEAAQAVAYLEDIEAEIHSRISDVASRATDANYRALLIRVEATAAKRVFMNPGGIRQHAQSVDDYSESDTFDVAISAGSLYISDDEWTLLGVVASSGGSGSFSMARGYL